MKQALRIIAVVSFIVATIWVIQVGELAPEPLLAFLAGLTTLVLSFTEQNKRVGESIDERNRRVMINHVETFWIKGILEKSLHGAVLLELGIKEDSNAVSYPWKIRKESTNEILPTHKTMLEIFQEVGLGRSLLILGAPGSGKTTMLLELTRQLIEHARKDSNEPIPVVFNLSSWSEKQKLFDWLVDQLYVLYKVPRKVGRELVGNNKLSLLLDGLDEVSKDYRSKCIRAINAFQEKYCLIPMVVCSRSDEYKALDTLLNLEGAIALQPLTPRQVNSYFSGFGTSCNGIKQLLRKDKVLRELAATPLMLSIMVLTYKGARTEDLNLSDSIETQRKLLFNTYIERMFDSTGRSKDVAFEKGKVLHWLSWLAKNMIIHNQIPILIEQIQPAWLDVKQKGRYRLGIILFEGLMIDSLVILLPALFLIFTSSYKVNFTWLSIGGIVNCILGYALVRSFST